MTRLHPSFSTRVQVGAVFLVLITYVFQDVGIGPKLLRDLNREGPGVERGVFERHFNV